MIKVARLADIYKNLSGEIDKIRAKEKAKEQKALPMSVAKSSVNLDGVS